MKKILERISNFFSKKFPLIVIVISIFALYQPAVFTWVVPYIAILLGIIMFGMGMTISFQDFIIIFKKPKDILLGICLQYLVMPLLAFILARIFILPKELAVGVILVGTCPGGTASNVMTFLAKGDVALSVAMTSVSTFLSPFLTPLITLVLARHWIAVNVMDMFISIAQIVLIPVILGMLVNNLFAKQLNEVKTILPTISVIAIILIIGGVVGANNEKIFSIIVKVFIVVALHNAFGFLVGYYVSKKCGVSKAKRKAIAIEVGMQNSGLAVSLAMSHFSALVAIPGTIFSIWHNIAGSILAGFWSRKD